MESANQTVRALPVTRAEGQAANRNRHGDCPRAIPPSLGRSIASSWHIDKRNVARGLWTARVVRCARLAHSPLRCNQIQGDRRRHQSCRSEGGTTAGEFLKPIMWLIIRSTPDARPGQPRTKKRKCGIQPAHQSLLTDVFASRLLLCTIHQCKNFTMSLRGDGKPCAVRLTGDIRVGWSGRAPTPTSDRSWEGAPKTRNGVR